jgi:hypothetical protein
LVLAGAFALYGLALAAATALLGRAPVALAAGAVALAGACGPLLTGGLSSRLAGIAPPDGRGQRRASGWDAVTYGLGGAAGPALVAAVAAAATPAAAMLLLGAAAGAAALVTLTLPAGAGPRAAAGRAALGMGAALRVVAATGPLRRATLAAMLTALAGGGLAVVAVALGGALGRHDGAGAMLVAAFGLGTLAASALVTTFPLSGEPDRLTARWSAAVGAGYALCALAPTYPLALAAFALAGAADAPLFTASLAARSQHAPPEARAQVFVSLAGARVAMASAGAALAGAAVALGPRALLGAAAALALAAAAGGALDRRVSRRVGRGGAAPSAAAPPRQPGRSRHRR